MKIAKMNMDIMAKAIVKAEIKCICGVPINSDPKMFNDEKGVLIEGHEKPQQVYFECPNCYNQTSLKKIIEEHQKVLSIFFVAIHFEDMMKDE